jgi:hypothetical protein
MLIEKTPDLFDDWIFHGFLMPNREIRDTAMGGCGQFQEIRGRSVSCGKQRGVDIVADIMRISNIRTASETEMPIASSVFAACLFTFSSMRT